VHPSCSSPAPNFESLDANDAVGLCLGQVSGGLSAGGEAEWRLVGGRGKAKGKLVSGAGQAMGSKRSPPPSTSPTGMR
jgi:hypothetical protein